MLSLKEFSLEKCISLQFFTFHVLIKVMILLEANVVWVTFFSRIHLQLQRIPPAHKVVL